MPETTEFSFSFERGVNLFDRPSVLPDGAAQMIQNFEWLPNGMLVPRPGWKAGGNSPTGAPASGNRAGRGLFLRWYESGVRKLVLALKDSGNAYSFYKTNVADPTTYASYTAIHTALAIPAANVNDIVRFAVGNNKLVYTSPGFPSGQLRRYDGTTADAIAVSNIAGRSIAYHLNRFWTGGGLTNPTYLRFSEIGSETSWNESENFIPVGQDDGEPIEDMVLWDRGLVIAKQHSLWFLAGRDPNESRLEPISAEIGGARGKCLIPTEFGIFIIGLAGEVYLYDGSEVRPVTRSVETPNPAATSYVSGTWTHGKLYVRSSNDEVVWCYEPGPDRWRKEVTQDTTSGPWDLENFDDQYVVATAEGSAAGRLLSVRSEHGAFATGSYRDPVHDVGVAQDYSATTREEWPQEAYRGRSTLRHVYIRYRQWAGGAAPLLTITPVVDGVDGTADTVGGKGSAGTYTERVDMNAEGRAFALRFSSSPTNAQNPTYSIEDVRGVALIERGLR